jgi:hypothetical protein
MSFDKVTFIKKALLFVSIIFLLYTIYHAINTTIFLYNFIPRIGQLPEAIQLPENFMSSTFPWTLLLMQEFTSSIGIYLRFFGGIFAFSSAILFNKNDSRYLYRFSKVLVFESLYFGLFIPSGINHVILSFSEFTFLGFNLYTGASFLLQGLILFPVLFLLSRKLKVNKYPVNLRWIGVAASLYVFGIWIKHAFFWFFALSMTTTQPRTLFETAGMINSIFTLLIATLISLYACTPLIRNTKKINSRIIGAGLTMIGIHFVIYFIVMVWVPIYLSFLGLTEFWMVSLLIPGLVALIKTKLHL